MSKLINTYYRPKGLDNYVDIHDGEYILFNYIQIYDDKFIEYYTFREKKFLRKEELYDSTSTVEYRDCKDSFNVVLDESCGIPGMSLNYISFKLSYNNSRSKCCQIICPSNATNVVKDLLNNILNCINKYLREKKEFIRENRDIVNEEDNRKCFSIKNGIIDEYLGKYNRKGEKILQSSISIPNDIKKVNIDLFLYSSINEIVFGSNVQEFNLKNAKNVKIIRYTGNLTSWMNCKRSLHVDNYDLYINNELIKDVDLSSYHTTQIEPFAFANVNIESVNLPFDLIKICSKAFYNCKRLKYIEIPKFVKCIERAAFMGCENLINVKMNDNLDRIESSAFYDVPAQNYSIPKTVKFLGAAAFGASWRNKNLYFEGSLTDWCSIEFEKDPMSSFAAAGKCVFINGEQLNKITIPNDVFYISKGTFYCINGLNEINISQNVSKIEKEAIGNYSKKEKLIITCNKKASKNYEKYWYDDLYTKKIVVKFK